MPDPRRPDPHGSRPVLVVRTDRQTRRFVPGTSCVIGSDPHAGVTVDHPLVAGEHAVLRYSDSWVLEDPGRVHGLFVDGAEVERVVIAAPRTVRLGDPHTGPVIDLAPAPQSRRRLARPHQRVVPPARSRPHRPTRQRRTVSHHPAAEQSCTTGVLHIGRADGNDLVLGDDLLVSRFHAELRRLDDGTRQLTDLDSHTGTYVNGERITTAVVTDADVIGIGHASFRLNGDVLTEFVDTGAVPFRVRNLTVEAADGRTILNDVSFPVGERSLLAVVGPSGCGKSTLLRALTGSQPAQVGSVHYGDRDLIHDYQELKHRIGLVPQEDILHTQLSARRGLRYAADLRFPADVCPRDRDQRVTEVIEELGLTDHADIPVAALSGGQRKRVSVALELLTRPSLLFLDEPTSGLDPGLDKSVMEMMRELADDGHTVIVVTHSVANLDLCDRVLVLGPGGTVAYFGPPQEALPYFGASGWPEVFQRFDRESHRDFGAEFADSARHTRYVAAALEAAEEATDAAAPGAPVAARTLVPEPAVGMCPDVAAPSLAGPHLPGPHANDATVETPVAVGARRSARSGAAATAASTANDGRAPQVAGGTTAAVRTTAKRLRRAVPTSLARGGGGRFAQFRTLCRRYLAVIGADRHYLAFLAGLPIAMGMLVRAVPAPQGLAGSAGSNGNAQELLLVLLIAGCFTGAANAVRELVKERAIYRRERASGLSPAVYLLAKLVVLSAITLVQTVVLLGVGLSGRSMPAVGALLPHTPILELGLAVAVPAVASVAIGLAISAMVNTAEKTMPLLVLLAMTQVVLSGALVPVAGRIGLEQAAWLSPGRWGLAAASSTVDLERIGPHVTPDPLWNHTAVAWVTDLGAVLALAVFFVVVAWWSLLRQDPAVERSAVIRRAQASIATAVERVRITVRPWLHSFRLLRAAPAGPVNGTVRRPRRPPRLP